MNTNFFTTIAGLAVNGTLQITITKSESDTLVVSTLLLNDGCGDKAKKLIIPLNLTGTACELDEGYFANISEPLVKSSGLMGNMEAFLRQLDEAKKQSAMQSSKEKKEQKVENSKDQKYKTAIALVDDLEKKGKFQDAWIKLPDPLEYPEHADFIRKRKTELSNRFAPDLFGAAVDPLPVQTEQTNSGKLESDPKEPAPEHSTGNFHHILSEDIQTSDEEDSDDVPFDDENDYAPF